MNHGLPAPSPDREPDPPADATLANDDAGVTPAIVDDDNDDYNLEPTEADLRAELSRKRIALLKELFMAFEFLLYAQLAVIYYLDNLSILFLLRASIQRAVFLSLTLPTPMQMMALPSSFTQALERSHDSKTQLAFSLGLTLLSILIHLFASAPTAGEPTRGYLQGGLLIDFIGQKAVGPWLSTFRLVLLDCLVACLQLFAVATSKESTKWQAASHSGDLERLVEMFLSSDRVASGPTASSATVQDGIELEPLVRGGEQDPIDHGDDRAWTSAHALDVMQSGQAVLLNIRPLQVLQDCILALRNRNPGAV